MSEVENKPKTRRRTATKEQRKAQLIKATIRSIAKHGLSVTTMSTVSKEAGLSQGIINLHFQSKDRLLEETLSYVADEYRVAWYKALDGAGDSAAEKLAMVVRVDFDKQICQRNKLAVWFAFWGESRSRPIYRQIYAQRDKEYRQVLKSLCAELISQGAYSCDPGNVANTLLAINQGLWLDMLLNPSEFTPELASATCMNYLQDIFPQHF